MANTNTSSEVLDALRVGAGESADLVRRDPGSKAGLPEDKKQRAELAVTLGREIDEWQEKLHAQSRQKLLVVLQGMDTSGKDGTVRSVFSSVDPLGVRVECFKAPSATELAHDYLWRVHAAVPAVGEITIFNRSHYEDVLITRVHGWIDAATAKQRFQHIVNFERMLVDTGTTIIKIMLHISKDEQRKRLEERRTDPVKQYKFNLGDLEERKHWSAYIDAYEDAINATSSKAAPWYVVPADSNSTRNACVAMILVHALRTMNPDYPPPTGDFSKIVID